MLHITFRINLEMHAAQRIMKQNILVKPWDTMKPTSPAYIDKTIRFWISILNYDTATQIWTILFRLKLAQISHPTRIGVLDTDIDMPSFRRKPYHDEISITDHSASCQFDSFRCSRWRKFHKNDISASAYEVHY